jgi:coenzyme PQQ precursor peptide PqqA
VDRSVVKPADPRPALSTPEDRKDGEAKKAWTTPIFKNLRLGFEITMYFWNR